MNLTDILRGVYFKHPFSLLLIFCCVVFFSSTIFSQSFNDISFKTEIQNLKTNLEKRSYLEKIDSIDQAIRNLNIDISSKYGKNSIEYCEVSSNMMLIDIINFKKIIYYLDCYDYPSIIDVGDKANLTPWLVIHHNFGMPFKYVGYEKLKKAWKDGVCSDKYFELYLHRILDSYFKTNPEDKNKTISELLIVSDNLFKK